MKKYVVIAAVIAVCVAGEIVLWGRYTQKSEAMIGAYKDARIAETEAKLKSLLNPSVLNEKNFAVQAKALEQFWSAFQAQTPSAFHTKIWNTESVIVWSNVISIIGKSYPENHELQESLKGEIEAEFELEGEKDEQISERRLDSFTEFYFPIRETTGAIVGSFEIYYAAGDFARSRDNAFTASLLQMAGLGVLGAVCISIAAKRIA